MQKNRRQSIAPLRQEDVAAVADLRYPKFWDNRGPLRNRIINSGCRIAARGPKSFGSTAFGYAAADRFFSQLDGTLTVHGHDSGPNTGFPSGYAAFTTVTRTGGTFNRRGYRMERRDIIDLALRRAKVSIGAWVWHDFGGPTTFRISLWAPTVDDTFSAYTQVGPNVDFTVPNALHTQLKVEQLDAIALTAAAEKGLEIRVEALVGALTAKTMYFSCLTLEEGEYVTPFEAWPLVVDQAACQRYFRRYSTATGGLLIPMQCIGTTNAVGHFECEDMRIGPTLSLSAASHFSVWSATGGGIACASLAGSNAGPKGLRIDANVASGLVAGNATMLFANTASGTFDLSAEL